MSASASVRANQASPARSPSRVECRLSPRGSSPRGSSPSHRRPRRRPWAARRVRPWPRAAKLHAARPGHAPIESRERDVRARGRPHERLRSRVLNRIKPRARRRRRPIHVDPDLGRSQIGGEETPHSPAARRGVSWPERGQANGSCPEIESGEARARGAREGSTGRRRIDGRRPLFHHERSLRSATRTSTAWTSSSINVSRMRIPDSRSSSWTPPRPGRTESQLGRRAASPSYRRLRARQARVRSARRSGARVGRHDDVPQHRGAQPPRRHPHPHRARPRAHVDLEPDRAFLDAFPDAARFDTVDDQHISGHARQSTAREPDRRRRFREGGHARQ